NMTDRLPFIPKVTMTVTFCLAAATAQAQPLTVDGALALMADTDQTAQYYRNVANLVKEVGSQQQRLALQTAVDPDVAKSVQSLPKRSLKDLSERQRAQYVDI